MLKENPLSDDDREDLKAEVDLIIKKYSDKAIEFGTGAARITVPAYMDAMLNLDPEDDKSMDSLIELAIQFNASIYLSGAAAGYKDGLTNSKN